MARACNRDGNPRSGVVVADGHRKLSSDEALTLRWRSERLICSAACSADRAACPTFGFTCRVYVIQAAVHDGVGTLRE